MSNDKKVKKHNDRPDLAGEHFYGDFGQLIFLVVFLAAWILDSFIFHYSTFISKYIPLIIRIIFSAIILIYSGFLARSGLKIVFGEIRKEPCVIKNGVFKIVRHPIYLGAILLYFGLIVLTFSLISVFIWILIIIFYYIISKYEEKILTKKFGNAYLQYITEVPMLIPRIFKR
ncbi:MAG: isoprenylcysteine carboxylmethyltransferase family protein [Bacteroidales bacterium]|nr:isoprenylcysteine carboxylmethyltransferase family protein [Bacteroidales bacterium]